MRYPSATAYMEALQDPSSCFADPELAAGQPALGPIGLPRAVSGNVATVFRVDSPLGRSWAVRCFVRPVDNERLRYEAIGAHLARLQSTWPLGFDLQPCGIRVESDWWPVLKMEWAPGEPLLSYVHRHLWDGPALAYLAQRFASLTECLRADGVAHGDLQHGNILVAPGGDLRLIDYDGMYVPALAGWGAAERGHRNYQHPGRRTGDFGPELDRFSSWVIFASLAALSVDPLLWGRLDGGDETLLLRHHDFEWPDRSPALTAMEASDGPGVAELAGLLRSFLAGEPDDVPPLSPGATTSPTGTQTPGFDLSRRLRLHEALLQGSLPATVPSVEAMDPPPTVFAGDLTAPRVTLVTAAMTVVVVAVIAVGGWLPPLLGALAALVVGLATVGCLHHQYRRSPEFRAAHRLGAVLGEPRRAAAAAAATVEELTRRRAKLTGDEDDAARRAEQARSDLRVREEQEARRAEEELEGALAIIRERVLDEARSEQAARANALGVLQARVQRAQLVRHGLGAASARGVSDVVIGRLAASGVRTLADFTDVVMERRRAVVVHPDGRRSPVDGMDMHEVAALTAWRREVEGAVQLKLPTILPPESLAAVDADHVARRAALAGEAGAVRDRGRRRRAEIRTRWQVEHDRIVVELKATEADAAHRRVELDRDLAQARKALVEAQWLLGEQERTVGRPPQLCLTDYLRQATRLTPRAPQDS